MVIAYRQDRFIRKVVRSVLAQTYEPLEIILSDDCSPDRTFDIMREEVEAYRGPHKIVLNRNDANLGVSGHINRVWELSTGEMLIAGAGDDIAYPQRASSLVSKWLETNKEADIVTCSHYDVLNDCGGIIARRRPSAIYMPNTEEHYSKWKCGVTGACAAYARRVYEGTGPLDPMVIAEDNVYPFWVWLRGGIVAIVQEVLLGKITNDENLHRVFASINSAKLRKDRKRLRVRAANDALARSREWLRFARKGPHCRGSELVGRLEQLVRLRTNQRQCLDAGILKAVQLAGDTLLSTGCIKHSAGVLLRGWGVY